jgi:6-phosphogluconolactonase
MSDSSSEDTHIFPTYDAMSRAAAQHVAAHIRTVLADQERYALALAGGSTPERLHEMLASGFPRLPWDRVDMYWGDERFVPSSSPQSNERMARRTLLSGLDVPFANVHPVPTDAGSPEAAAEQYETVLRDAFADRDHTFDLVLLGLGGDGHTASLFPEDDPSPDDDAWVRAVTAPPRHDVRDRITCTLPVLNGAREAVFLVSGESKKAAVERIFSGDTSLPAARVAPRDRLTWFMDEAAGLGIEN